MRFEDIYCKVGVKFLNKNKLSDKTYYYLITKDWINNKRETALKAEINHLCDPCAFFKIINEKSYDYKGAEVAIVDVVREFGLEDTLELTAIKDLFYTRTDEGFSSLKYLTNTFKLEDFSKPLVTEEARKSLDALWDKIKWEPYVTDITGSLDSSDSCSCNCSVDALSSSIKNISSSIDSLSSSLSSINVNSAESAASAKTTSSTWYTDYTDLSYSPYTTSTTPLTQTNTITIDTDRIVIKGTIDDYVTKEEFENYKKESEEKKMFNFENLKNKFQFGEYKDAKMSPYGIAFQNGNEYFAVNTKTMEVIDATGLVFDFNCVYAMPVAANAVKVGDFIIHNYCPVLVRAIHEDGTLKCWHINAHEVITVLPVKSPFGFNFYTKLVSLVDNMGMTPTDANPFGNIWPLLLMDGKKDNKDMMMLMMLMNQQGGQFNPMMMYMMMNGNKNDFLPMMLMMNGGFNFGMTPAANNVNCNCNCNAGEYTKIINGEA